MAQLHHRARRGAASCSVRMRIELALKVFAPLVLLLAACTVTTNAPDPAGDGEGVTKGDAPDAGTTGDAAPSPDSSTDDSPEPSSIPAELIGTPWTWVTSAGAHRLELKADGTYTSDVLLNGHPGDSCGTEYFTQYAGTATVAGDTLRLQSPDGTRTKTNSCSNTTESKDVIDAQDATYTWRVEDDSEGERSLVLVNGEGHESRYYPE